MARNSKKEENLVSDTATTGEETKAPTQSLFGNVSESTSQGETETAAETETVAQSDEATTESVAAAGEAVTVSDRELENLSVEELRRRQEEITRTLDEKTNAEKKGVLDQVILVIAEYGITTEEVVTALGGYKVKRKGTPARVKFRDPVTGAEWSGRGKEPLWIKGKDRAQFSVDNEQAIAA